MSRSDFSPAPLPTDLDDEREAEIALNASWAEQHKSFRGKRPARFFTSKEKPQRACALREIPPEVQADLDALSRGTVFMKSLVHTKEDKGSSPQQNGHKSSTSSSYNFAFKFHDFPRVQTVCLLRGTPEFSAPPVGKPKTSGKFNGSDTLSPERVAENGDRPGLFFAVDQPSDMSLQMKRGSKSA